MNSEVSCFNTRAIFDYLLRKSIDPGPYLVDLCPDLDQIEDPLEYLNDRNNWVSSAVITRLLARLSRELEDPQLPFRIGYDSVVHRRFGYIQDIFLRLFTSPLQGLRKAQEVNDRFNRTKRVDLSDLSPGRAVVRLNWFEGMELSRDICLYNQGIYSAIPRVWGLKPASLIETQCAFDGGEICEYRLRWQPVPRFLGAARKFFVPRALFEQTVQEIEADKNLLGKKYREVQDLSVRLRQKIRELETLHESGKAIVSILDRKDLLNVIMRLATTTLGYDRAMIMLLNEEEKSLVMAASSGASPEQMKQFGGYRIPLSRAGNVLVRAFESGTPFLVDELSRRSLNQNNPILQTFSPTSFAIVPLINRGKVIGVMAADRAASKEEIVQEDLDYLVGFGNHVAVALENSRLYQSVEQTYLGAIQSLARAVEAKDPYTSGHSERVGHFSEWLADSIDLPEAQTRTLVLACRIHDIGKIGVTEKILHKPGKLERDEKTVIRQHPVTGEAIIRPLKGLEEVARIIRHHHERYDGTGYPDRLKGDSIPVEARMMAIADCYDAMTTRRPYRKPLPAEVVLRELKDNRGTQFDPHLTDSFLSLLEAGTFSSRTLRQPWPREV
jgi:HD-GYP domain-containing protein (c-di-GMP phosphodiesterase class II)